MRAANFARSGWGNIAFQATFLALLYLAGNDAAPELSGVSRLLLLLALVIVPSLVWPSFFYLRDRTEPEPSGHVIAALLAGMAAASVVVIPLEANIFNLNSWMYESALSLLLGSMLIRGALVSFMFFVVIRYAFLPLQEFDEPEDGMVYGAFLGAGFAAVKSMSYLAVREDFTLFAIAHVASTNILLYASVGSLVGFLVGRAKFSQGNPQLAFLAALLTGMMLIGGYHTLHEMVFISGSEAAFGMSAALTLVFAAALLIGASALMHWLEQAGAPQVMQRRPRRDMPVVMALVLILMLGGFAKASIVRDRIVSSDVYGVTFGYPALDIAPSFAGMSSLGRRTVSSTIFSGESRNASVFRVAVKGEPGVADLSTMDPNRYIGRELLWLSMEPVTISEKQGVRARYAYVDMDPVRLAQYPGMVWGYADIIPNATHTVVFTYEAPPEDFTANAAVYDRILATVNWATN